MQKAFSCYLILSVASLLTLGAFAMQEGVEDQVGWSCIAAAVKGVACPEGAGLFGFLSFHIGAMKDLGIAGASVLQSAATMFLFFFAFFLYAGVLAARAVPVDEEPARYLGKNFKSLLIPLSRTRIYWLSLREHSPTVF